MQEHRPQPRLNGKTALITGASRGIGLAIAQAFAKEGAHLILTASAEPQLVDAVAQLSGLTESVTSFAADLSDPSALADLFEFASGWKPSGLDILVNNAGIYIGKPFVEYDLTEFDKIMQINVYAVFQLMQQALRHMQARQYGKIINIASTGGKWESLNQSAYNASKHAVVGLTRCAALENAQNRITVNAICPGMVDTDMFQDFEVHADAQGISLAELKEKSLGRIPIGRFLDAEEVTPLAVYLASDESKSMTGQTITISGGMRMG